MYNNITSISNDNIHMLLIYIYICYFFALDWPCFKTISDNTQT